MVCEQLIILRIILALSGIVMLSAASTALTELVECTVVQTPQIRDTNVHASRGSLPFSMTSKPLHIVPATQASAIFPPSTLASTRMCPSIRVMGSTTIFAILFPPYSLFLPLVAVLIAAWAAIPAAATAAMPSPILSALAITPAPGTLGILL